MLEKEQPCSIAGCENATRHDSGHCQTCRTYLSRVSAKSVGWRVARRARIAVWDERLQLVLSGRKTRSK